MKPVRVSDNNCCGEKIALILPGLPELHDFAIAAPVAEVFRLVAECLRSFSAHFIETQAECRRDSGCDRAFDEGRSTTTHLCALGFSEKH
jgi:hypothetical protein